MFIPFQLLFSVVDGLLSPHRQSFIPQLWFDVCPSLEALLDLFTVLLDVDLPLNLVFASIVESGDIDFKQNWSLIS